MSDLALQHIRHLAVTIGPRGSCTPQERQASDYCGRVLRDLGYEAEMEEFRALRSGWAPYSMGMGLVLLSISAVLLLPVDAWGLPAALELVVLISLLRHLAFRPNPLVWLVPTGVSQNVYIRGRPVGDARRTVVVTGHVDTHRTPVAMYSPRAFRLFVGLTTAAIFALLALQALFWLWMVLWWSGGFRPDPAWRLLTVPPGLVILLAFAATLQPEFTRFVPGANDNASGAAAVLALAARLKSEPLRHTEVWLVNSGAEEVGATGPVHLLKRHPELKHADWIVLDTIAGPGAGPCLITAEHVFFPLRADAGLLRAGRAVAAARADLGVYEHYFRGLYSEHSPLTAAGCRSLAIIDFTPEGALPNWHRPSDTFENIDPQVLDRTEQFVWALLKEIDRRVVPEQKSGS